MYSKVIYLLKSNQMTFQFAGTPVTSVRLTERFLFSSIFLIGTNFLC